MQKIKHYFQMANKEISSGNVYMIQIWFTLFDRNSCFTFKLSTAWSTLNQSNSIAITQYIHTEHLKTTTTIFFDWKKAICSLTKKKEKKKEKLKESLHITLEMTRRSNYNLSLNLRKLRINKITTGITESGSKWKTFRLYAMILHS